MKYYDEVIGLGQYCITSTALRRCGLQKYSMPFDWSAGIIEEKCGLGGLAGKVDLICRDFKDFFNKEDFENRGKNEENDVDNLWIVNTRTGIQYKHDFPSSIGFDDKFLEVKEKYLRRANRCMDILKSGKSVLFVFMARDEGFTDEYIEQQYIKIKNYVSKYGTKCDFLYIMHDSSCSRYEKKIICINKNVKRINMNFTYSNEPYPESWNGNKKVYYPILINGYANIHSVHNLENEIKKDFTDCISKLKKLSCNLLLYIKSCCVKYITLFKYN